MRRLGLFHGRPYFFSMVDSCPSEHESARVLERKRSDLLLSAQKNLAAPRRFTMLRARRVRHTRDARRFKECDERTRRMRALDRRRREHLRASLSRNKFPRRRACVQFAQSDS